MKIITNSQILNVFKTIDIFTLDLGKSSRSEDIFIKQYYNDNNEKLFKFGNIGSIEFYENHSVFSDQIIILHNKQEFEFKYTDDDKKLDAKEYLSTIIKSVEEYIDTIINKNTQSTEGVWENKDPESLKKGNKKFYDIRQDVNREEYIKLFLQKRK